MPVGLMALALLGGCATETVSQDNLNQAYQDSIAVAAVKQPSYVKVLQPIDASKAAVRVAHVQPYPTIDTSRYTWIAPPDALRALCQGRADPLLALQQALGLPPEQNNAVRVFTFDVSPAAIFRPCASSPDITTTQCSVDLPAAAPSGVQAAAEHFVLKQIMDSYRTGFKASGYPFTAMGWSYDWDPASPTHQGISEYVVRPGATISNVISVTPAAFCQMP
jgi:hypothetical protein